MSFDMKIVLQIICILTLHTSFAQDCDNIRAEYDNRKVYILYDLNSSNENASYFVSATCSKDGFKESLKFVSGAAGRNVKPGKNLKITWDCKKEYQEINLNEIDFKVAASDVAPANYFPVQVSGKLKRGNTVTISWFSGSADEEISIVLCRRGNHYRKIVNTLDLGSFQWEIPDSIEKGGDFQVKIITIDKNELYSERFEIR